MKAWVISEITSKISDDNHPLKLMEFEIPEISKNEILIKVHACGVCHTEIDEIEGRAMPSFLPIIPGHQIVGEVVDKGNEVKRFKIGERVGAGWIYSACGKCEFCLQGLENLCEKFEATGKDVHGGYAEYFKIHEDFAFHLPQNISYENCAPLFCAGAIGYRALRLANVKDGDNIGLVGFGASNHIVLKVIKNLFPNIKIFVFSRNEKERKFALELGSFWVGEINQLPPERLNAVIDTTPVWYPPISALKYLKASGKLVINAIRKEDIDKECLLYLNYENDLWKEKEIKTVANITKKDIEEFLKVASEYSIYPEIEKYSFSDANKAIIDIKNRNIRGSKVLIID